MRRRDAGGAVLAVAFLVVGGVALAGSARAAPVPENGHPGQLSLTADPFPLGTHDMVPGAAVRWQIAATVDQAGGSTLFLSVVGHGVMAQDPAGLTLAVAWCPVAWMVPTDVALPASCAGGGSTTVLVTTPIASIGTANRWIGALARGVPSHVLVTVALPPSANSRFVGDSGSVDLVFQAGGDSETVTVGPGGRLASTGSVIAGPALLAAGLLLSGIVAASIRGPRRRRVGPTA